MKMFVFRLDEIWVIFLKKKIATISYALKTNILIRP